MSELFNGQWRIDLDRSLVWDDKIKKHVADRVGEEVITLRVIDGVQDYEVLYGDSPRIRMGYTSRYDDPEWVPYIVRAVEGGRSEKGEDAVAAFKARINASEGHRERQFVVGKPYGLVRTVYVDDRTHYRVSKDPATGQAQSMLLRRMAADGRSYLATVMDLEGIPFRVRWFVRMEYHGG